MLDSLARGDKREVYYYEGFYGSLVADAESDRLLGKIEGISEDIVYVGRTVKECEQRFGEAVSQYKKKTNPLQGLQDRGAEPHSAKRKIILE